MTGEEIKPYDNSFEHLRDELRRLDLRIRLCTKISPLLNQIAPGDQVHRTAFISPEEVMWLLGPSVDGRLADPEVLSIREALAEASEMIGARAAATRDDGIVLALPRIAELFRLSEFEAQALIICLAPELRIKYDRLYAYLQDDITRRRPSVDLILNLLCESEDERWQMRPLLSTGALVQWQLVQPVADPHSPSGSTGLAQFLRLDPRICRFLMGDGQLDPRLTGVARLNRGVHKKVVVDDRVASTIRQQLSARRDGAQGLVIYFQGSTEADNSAVVLEVCHDMGLAVIVADMEQMLALPADQSADLIRIARREAVLQEGVVYLERADALVREQFGTLARVLRQIGADRNTALLLGGEQPWTASHLFVDTRFETVVVPAPDLTQRAEMWRRHLHNHSPRVVELADDLAARFTFGENRIREMVSRAEQRVASRSADAVLSAQDITAACRAQANQNLGGLAVNVEPRYGWQDLVLPETKIQQLNEICDQVRHHRLVYDTWGFGRKIGYGTGLTVLFSGPPGTGKTMAAEVVARAVGLRLLKIDLSGVVSKYIGETEKNLAKIFAEARSGNVILFFDEADALYGKRTEVSDAHDRYANIETSYLLQKLEEHEGLVLLASNLRANFDVAFTRRIRYIVDFPFPDSVSRQRIWERHFPPEAPLSEDVDFAALADEFAIAGGSIKNIALNAAFLAATNGQRVETVHIISGARREFEKLGKLWCEPAGRREVTS